MIALELLPQARVRVRMFEERRLFIDNNTFFGQLVGAVQTLEMVYSGAIAKQDQTPFPDGDTANDDWISFVQAVKSRRKKIVLETLVDLLAAAKGEMMYALELPPLPPPYHYQEMSYSPSQVH